MKKYLKIGNFYIAIHMDDLTVFIVRDEPDNCAVKVIKSAEEIDHVLTYESAEEISVELFQEKFSKIIDHIHTNTPYA